MWIPLVPSNLWAEEYIQPSHIGTNMKHEQKSFDALALDLIAVNDNLDESVVSASLSYLNDIQAAFTRKVEDLRNDAPSGSDWGYWAHQARQESAATYVADVGNNVQDLVLLDVYEGRGKKPWRFRFVDAATGDKLAAPTDGYETSEAALEVANRIA